MNDIFQSNEKRAIIASTKNASMIQSSGKRENKADCLTTRIGKSTLGKNKMTSQQTVEVQTSLDSSKELDKSEVTSPNTGQNDLQHSNTNQSFANDVAPTPPRHPNPTADRLKLKLDQITKCENNQTDIVGGKDKRKMKNLRIKVEEVLKQQEQVLHDSSRNNESTINARNASEGTNMKQKESNQPLSVINQGAMQCDIVAQQKSSSNIQLPSTYEELTEQMSAAELTQEIDQFLTSEVFDPNVLKATLAADCDEMINWENIDDKDMLYMMYLQAKGLDFKGQPIANQDESLSYLVNRYLNRQILAPQHYKLRGPRGGIKKSVHIKMQSIQQQKIFEDRDKMKEYQPAQLKAFNSNEYEQERDIRQRQEDMKKAIDIQKEIEKFIVDAGLANYPNPKTNQNKYQMLREAQTKNVGTSEPSQLSSTSSPTNINKFFPKQVGGNVHELGIQLLDCIEEINSAWTPDTLKIHSTTQSFINSPVPRDSRLYGPKQTQPFVLNLEQKNMKGQSNQQQADQNVFQFNAYAIGSQQVMTEVKEHCNFPKTALNSFRMYGDNPDCPLLPGDGKQFQLDGINGYRHSPRNQTQTPGIKSQPKEWAECVPLKLAKYNKSNVVSEGRHNQFSFQTPKNLSPYPEQSTLDMNIQHPCQTQNNGRSIVFERNKTNPGSPSGTNYYRTTKNSQQRQEETHSSKQPSRSNDIHSHPRHILKSDSQFKNSKQQQQTKDQNMLAQKVEKEEQVKEQLGKLFILQAMIENKIQMNELERSMRHYVKVPGHSPTEATMTKLRDSVGLTTVQASSSKGFDPGQTFEANHNNASGNPGLAQLDQMESELNTNLKLNATTRSNNIEDSLFDTHRDSQFNDVNMALKQIDTSDSQSPRYNNQPHGTVQNPNLSSHIDHHNQTNTDNQQAAPAPKKPLVIRSNQKNKSLQPRAQTRFKLLGFNKKQIDINPNRKLNAIRFAQQQDYFKIYDNDQSRAYELKLLQNKHLQTQIRNRNQDVGNNTSGNTFELRKALEPSSSRSTNRTPRNEYNIGDQMRGRKTNAGASQQINQNYSNNGTLIKIENNINQPNQNDQHLGQEIGGQEQEEQLGPGSEQSLNQSPSNSQGWKQDLQHMGVMLKEGLTGTGPSSLAGDNEIDPGLNVGKQQTTVTEELPGNNSLMQLNLPNN